jgi:hypothetical protein
MQVPTRPFESLEWFRDASRGEIRPRGPLRNALRWLKSSRCFAFHIGLFALGITIALAVNVARNPGDIWVDRLAIGWAILLVIHAGAALLVWAIGLLTGNEPAPVYPGPVFRPRELQATVPRPMPQPAAPPAAGVPDPATAWPAPPPPTPASPQSPPATPDWSPWGQPVTGTDWTTAPAAPVTPAAAPTGEEESTASWDATTPDAWLGRRRRIRDESAETADTPVPAPDGPLADSTDPEEKH